MRHLTTLLLCAALLALLLPAAVRAEDPPAEDPPAKPEKPEGDPGILPATPPPAEEGEDEDGAGDEEGPATAVEDAAFRKRKVIESARDGYGVEAPAGMVYVPPGTAVIGTPYEELARLVSGRDRTIVDQFIYEAPQHKVAMDGFFLDRYEVTNAQYYAFLQDVARETHKTEGALANLDEIAAHFLRLPLAVVEDKDAIFSRQLYDANWPKLHEKLPQLVTRVPGGELDHDATFRKMRRAPIPVDLELEFYSLVPPKDWGGLAPPEDLLDLPVRWVSYDDAERFAEWAGKHIPTEFEWEYAARGPEGFVYPWGDQWFPDERKANWGAKIIDKRFKPRTIPVDGNPPAFAQNWQGEVPAYDGQSWCGAWHMLGNVWEWTSSWFNAYPGNDRQHGHMGEFLKVQRGASFEDIDPLALRLSARNWVGLGAKGPPVPQNRFDNVGFRCAWYGNPGQDLMETALRRAYRAKIVKPENVARDRWAGASATRFAPNADSVEHHVYVQGQAHTILLIPRSYLLKDGDKLKIKKRNDLLKASVNDEDPFPLAVLHTDVPLVNVFVRDFEAMAREDEKKGSGRRRVKAEAPPTMKGSVPAGTYLVAFWHERLCLTQTSLEFTAFLSKATTPSGQLEIKSIKKDKGLPDTQVEVTPVADMIEIAFAVPVGGEKNDDGLTICVEKVTLESAKGALEGAGEWKMGRARVAAAKDEAKSEAQDGA